MIDATALSEKPVLTGARIRLAPLSIRHAAAFHTACQDPDTRRLTGTHYDFTLAELQTWCAGSAGSADRLDLAIEDRERLRAGQRPGRPAPPLSRSPR
ncbi:GNAT family N-acetyltransferase [Streptomyces nigrescens]